MRAGGMRVLAGKAREVVKLAETKVLIIRVNATLRTVEIPAPTSGTNEIAKEERVMEINRTIFVRRSFIFVPPDWAMWRNEFNRGGLEEIRLEADLDAALLARRGCVTVWYLASCHPTKFRNFVKDLILHTNRLSQTVGAKGSKKQLKDSITMSRSAPNIWKKFEIT